MNAVSYVGRESDTSDAVGSKQSVNIPGHIPSVSCVFRHGMPPIPGNDPLPSPSCRLDGARVFIAGHSGLLGSALRRRLLRQRCEILTVDRSELDLRRQADTERWMADNRPDIVLLAAATVGGIAANSTRPAEFITDNLAISLNVIEASRVCAVQKLVFLGSSCIYPRLSRQPITEDALLSGPLEPTNEAYAVAKIAGLKLAQAIRRQYGCDFISIMPANLYGRDDTFDPARGHVIPALVRRIVEAKTVNAPECVVWGTGQARREFLHVDDCADGIIHALQFYSREEPLNLGSGEEVSIATLATLIATAAGYSGRLVFDQEQPDGTPRKLLDSSRIRSLGWRPRIRLRDGLNDTIRWWIQQGCSGRRQHRLQNTSMALRAE